MFKIKVPDNAPHGYAGATLDAVTEHPYAVEGGAVVIDHNGNPIGSGDLLAPNGEGETEPVLLGAIEVVSDDMTPEQLTEAMEALKTQGYIQP